MANIYQKIKVALCSFGLSGKAFHAPFISTHRGFELYAVLERSKNIVTNFYPNTIIYKSIDRLLCDPEIDLVIVNTPDETHFAFARLALKAGKHVVVEKPFTQTFHQAVEIIELAKQNNLMLTAFQNRRLDGDFLTIKQIVNNQLLGRLVEFESHFDRYKTAVDLESWKEKSDTNILYNLGAHMIDQALVLFGMPVALSADLRCLRDNSKNVDNYDLRFYYDNLKVTLKATYLARENSLRYVLHGTKGSYIKYGIDPQEALLRTGHLPNETNWGRENENFWGTLNTNINGLHFKGKIETIAGSYQNFYENIYQHLNHDEPLAVDPLEAAQIIKIIEVAIKSDKLKQAVSLLT